MYSSCGRGVLFHRRAANPSTAARKPPGMLNGTAALDGAVVVWEVGEADKKLAELDDALALLLLAEAELDDADVKLAELAEVELAEMELADAELAEEPEADEAEALPVLVATNAV